jgi:hypothetical protein
MNSNGITRASSEGLKLAGPGGRSILLKAGSTETQGAYSLLKFTAPAGRPAARIMSTPPPRHGTCSTAS